MTTGPWLPETKKPLSALDAAMQVIQGYRASGEDEHTCTGSRAQHVAIAHRDVGRASATTLKEPVLSWKTQLATRMVPPLHHNPPYDAFSSAMVLCSWIPSEPSVMCIPAVVAPRTLNRR